MFSLVSQVRKSQYYDSAVLMQLQKFLSKLEGVLDVGVLMGTDANKVVLIQSGLHTPDIDIVSAEDLIIVVKGIDDASASSALKQVDEFLLIPKQNKVGSYRPKSLDTAFRITPQSNWVFVSVNGRYAPEIVDRSLDTGKHVFLFSDNVSIDDERRLKEKALKKGLMVLGPDCGTAIINGVGFGFANRVKHGKIGIVAASGTGLQSVAVAIDNLGEGISHGIGTGGRDLKEEIGAITCFQALNFLNDDPQTELVVLLSKPPAIKVVDKLMNQLLLMSKPVIILFIGSKPPTRQLGNVYFALSLLDAAMLAVQVLHAKADENGMNKCPRISLLHHQQYVRGLFSGGTIAYEVMCILKNTLNDIYSNIPLEEKYRLKDISQSHGHTILDLGEDEFTVGKLHPMIDNDFRIRRIVTEANDPTVGIIILDIVLGFCAHSNPAGELADVIAKVINTAKTQGRVLSVIALVIGTENDIQNSKVQTDALYAAGAIVVNSAEDLVLCVSQILSPTNVDGSVLPGFAVDAEGFTKTISVINVGLELFYEALISQGVPVIQVNWCPPANGNERLIKLLNRLKKDNEDAERDR